MSAEAATAVMGGQHKGFDSGFHFVHLSHVVGMMRGGSRVTPVGFSECLVIIDDGIIIALVGLFCLDSLEFLLMENVLDRLFSCLLASLFFVSEPFEATDIELLLRLGIAFLDHLDDLVDLELDALLLDGKEPT